MPDVMFTETAIIPGEVFLDALADRLAGKTRPSPKLQDPEPLRMTATAAPARTYLVTVYCLSDNVPAGLFTSRFDAEEFARRVAGDPQRYVERFRKLTEVDPVFYKESSLLSVDLVEFHGNVPVSREVIVSLDRDRQNPGYAVTLR